MAYGQSRSYLFAEGDLDGTIRQHFGKIRQHVEAIAERDLLARDEVELRNEVIAEFEIHPVVLDEASKSMVREEVQVDVTGDRSRYFSSDRGPHYVPGIRLRISIPFQGDAILWKLRPNQWRSTFPHGEIHADHGGRNGLLQVVIDYPADSDAAQAKGRFDEIMRDVAFYLDSQKKQIEDANRSLSETVRMAVQERKNKLARHSQGLEEAFGIPIAPPSVSSPPTAASKPASSAARSKSVFNYIDRWDVFLSHASEDKDDVARPLFNALNERGLSVWFDEFTLRVGDSLRRSIDKGLAGARYGIVVVSPHFLEKEWPQKELDALVGRESGGVKVILPVWHKVDADYVRRYSPLLADRLASSFSKGLTRVVDELLAAIKD